MHSLRTLLLGLVKNIVWLVHPRLPWRLAQRRIASRAERATSSPAKLAAARAQMEYLLGAVASPGEIEAAAPRYLAFTELEAELRWHPERSTSHRVEGVEHLRAAHAEGRGVILHFAHHGFYSGMFGSVRRASGIDVHTLAFSDAKAWDLGPNVRQHLRVVARGGGMVIAAEGREGIKARLDSGAVVAMASDAPGSSVVEFAGRQVKCSSGAVWAARDADCPIVLVDTWQTEDGPVLRLQPAVRVSDFADNKALLQHLVTAHEEAILAWPEAMFAPTLTWPHADDPASATGSGTADGAPTAGGARGRFGATLLDQAICGASNVLFSVMAARLLDTEGFGFFGVVFLTYTLASLATRAVVCEPVLIQVDARSRSREIFGAALMVGVAASALLAVAGAVLLAVTPPLGAAILALAAAFPLLAVQDTVRYLGIAEGEPGRAVFVDTAWLVLALAGAAALAIAGLDRPWQFVATWGGAGALAGLAGHLRTTGGRAALHLGWVKASWRYSWRYFLLVVMAQGAALGMTAVVGVVAGAAGVAVLAGAALLNRPYSVFQIAATTFGTAEIAKSDDRARIDRIARLLTLIALVAAGIGALILVELPDALGRLLLGESWTVVEPACLAVGVQLLVMALPTGPRAGLLGLRQVSATVPIAIIDSAMLVGLGSLGVMMSGPVLGIWFVNAGLVVTSALWWYVFRQAKVAPEAGPGPRHRAAVAT